MSEGGLSRVLAITNQRGLHARAAAKLVTLAEKFSATVEVGKEGGDGEMVSARSIMGLMMLGAGMGSSILVRTEGWDAKEAMDAVTALVEARFQEGE